MRVRTISLGLLFAGLVFAIAGKAQEGHPLTGTWYGEWGPEGDRNQVTMVLSFDGETATGIMDPGPFSAAVEVSLDSSNWTVHIEAVSRGAGQPVSHVADGTMESVGSRSRSIVGTWRSGGVESDFRMTREE